MIKLNYNKFTDDAEKLMKSALIQTLQFKK